MPRGTKVSTHFLWLETPSDTRSGRSPRSGPQERSASKNQPFSEGEFLRGCAVLSFRFPTDILAFL